MGIEGADDGVHQGGAEIGRRAELLLAVGGGLLLQGAGFEQLAANHRPHIGDFVAFAEVAGEEIVELGDDLREQGFVFVLHCAAAWIEASQLLWIALDQIEVAFALVA